MFVLVVSRGAPSDSDPLRGIFELDQARALQDAGCRVVLAALDVRSVRHRRPMGVHVTSVDGIDTVRLDLPLGRMPARLDHAAHARAMKRLWTAVVQRFGTPDVVHAHFARYAAALVRAGLPGGGVPLVVTEHDSQLRSGATSRLRAEDCRVAYGAADRVLAVSGALARILVDEYATNVEVVPDVVDVDLFARAAAHQHRDLNTLVSVGSLIERKGMVELCRTVIASAQTFPHLRLRIIGDGPLHADLQTLLADQDPDHRITLLGRTDRARVAREVAGAGGFVMFSRWETFGVAYAEALAAGTPVLATPCGGPEGFIGPDAGLVTRGFEAGDLRAGLTDFVERLAGFDAEQIARGARDRFSPQALAATLQRIYRELIG
ncbi:glycosyltransferase [Acidipropionibacterium jensenii]|uniref:GDP-mannose-dependent alpha-(1-6)-phosphatidylinositol monomannoside mannosyltransferase n=1 Tax=Acidipropionibacterium jensenii TaxID=1749 RepID=A0A3S4UWN8_9ACTN|nr:glycosyltransferase [Acidipropionibacterium jensenii]MDN5976320.1 glycosyltransferase [Acidipropionibacterium jensenii]MDN5995405.1 glycosyltransferase [Acidipropionibacterium jensenii]MDN6426514.1 glycosyltransferase [Acidipropionibacterium jensenii]MDN6441206.1 glycosyltransferase [Acidipropionibacterium jensenii]MDN6479205.1 glycosyltransferase [Acidipropionibacterium jensenii]